MWKKRLTRIVLCIVAVILIWNHLPYYYSNDKTVDYATSHAEKKSRCMCAGYVMQAMWHGGCPIGLLPAYGYNKTLPQMGFKEIPSEEYKPLKGDICVLPQNKRSTFGHIAIYNGSQWVSDFKQSSLYPSRAYRENDGAQYFRATDGWHWKHVWTSPADWYGWIEAAIKGWEKIKF